MISQHKETSEIRSDLSIKPLWRIRRSENTKHYNTLLNVKVGNSYSSINLQVTDSYRSEIGATSFVGGMECFSSNYWDWKLGIGSSLVKAKKGKGATNPTTAVMQLLLLLVGRK